jgi:putative FmdB family regulatory protein
MVTYSLGGFSELLLVRVAWGLSSGAESCAVMPIYEYNCKKCGVFEVTQRITASPLTTCPTCAGDVARLISLTSFVLKGSGWYVTDYARNGKGGGSGDSASTDSATNGSNDKPASSSSESSKSSSSESSTSGSDKGASSKAAD